MPVSHCMKAVRRLDKLHAFALVDLKITFCMLFIVRCGVSLLLDHLNLDLVLLKCMHNQCNCIYAFCSFGNVR